MIKSVLLDLDDTLLDFHKAEEIALRETLIRMELEPRSDTIALYSTINAGLWEMLEQGRIQRQQILTQRFDRLFAALGVNRSAGEAKEIYGGLLGTGHYFMPGAPELLEELSPCYDLYLASNGSVDVQESRIASAGIAHYFKGIFLSQQLGADKPQKGFFDGCFRAIPHFSHESTIMVGDSLTSDICGGIRAGIHTCWYNPDGKPRRQDILPEYEINQLGELPPLLEKI